MGVNTARMPGVMSSRRESRVTMSTTFAFSATSGDSGKRVRAVFTNDLATATSSSALLSVTFAPTVTANRK